MGLRKKNQGPYNTLLGVVYTGVFLSREATKCRSKAIGRFQEQRPGTAGLQFHLGPTIGSSKSLIIEVDLLDCIGLRIAEGHGLVSTETLRTLISKYAQDSLFCTVLRHTLQDVLIGPQPSIDPLLGRHEDHVKDGLSFI